MEHRKFDRELEQARSSGSRINTQYNTAAPNSLPARIAHYQRRKMFRAFMAFAAARPQDTILDVGVTSDRSYDHSNYFCAWYPHKAAITAVGLDDASFLSTLYPGLRFIRADGRDLIVVAQKSGMAYAIDPDKEGEILWQYRAGE